MATIYNLTNATNATNVYDVATAVHAASDGVAGAAILWTMFFITFISMKGWRNVDAFAATSFGYSILALMFFYANLLSEVMLFIFGIMGGLGVLMLIFRR